MWVWGFGVRFRAFERGRERCRCRYHVSARWSQERRVGDWSSREHHWKGTIFIHVITVTLNPIKEHPKNPKNPKNTCFLHWHLILCIMNMMKTSHMVLQTITFPCVWRVIFSYLPLNTDAQFICASSILNATSYIDGF